MQLDSEILETLRFHYEAMANLQKQIDQTSQSAIDLSPLKVGDKVLYKGRVYFVFNIRPQNPRYFKFGFCYELTSPKKDGTMPSKFIDGCYSVRFSDLEPVID